MKSKPLTFLLALTFLFLFLTGFSLGGFVDDLRFKGTTIGVTKCVERNQQEGLPNSFIKGNCIKKNHKNLESNTLDGSTGYGSTFSYSDPKKSECLEPSPLEMWAGGCRNIVSNYVGTIKNTTKDKVITRFEIHVSHEDNIDSSGKKITEILPFKVWILPNKSFKVNVSKENLMFHPNLSRKSLSTWSIRNVKGVDFILK